MYTRIALRASKVSYSHVGEGGVAVYCEKTQFFLNTLYMIDSVSNKDMNLKKGNILSF